MIDYDLFLNWAEKKFDSVQTSTNEVKLNSIYDPDDNDDKHKLWCRPELEGREEGVYHCWISNKKGTLLGLVMDVEGCSYEEACEILGYGGAISHLDEKLAEFFGTKKPETVVKPEPKTKILSMPEGVVPISSLNTWTFQRRSSEEYLGKRNIPSTGLYFGVSGEYRERVVIPYYDADGNLIYYNGRYIGSNTKLPKYKGPPKEIGVGKSDVVYMPNWKAKGSLHVTEGEFDSIALNLCGLASCAVGGSNLSEYQRKVFKDRTVILCGDIDKPGAGAVLKAGNALLEEGFKDIWFVRPAVGYKDWNDLYVKFGELVPNYIKAKMKPFDLITAEQLFAK